MHDRDESKEINPVDRPAEVPADGLQHLPTELQSFEAALAQLRPSAAQLDRDRLMFLAGQASVEGRDLRARSVLMPAWFWPASSAVMTGVAATLLLMLVGHADPLAEQVGQAPTRPIPVVRDPVLTDVQDGAAPAGTWTILRQRRLADDLSGSDWLAQTSPSLPDSQPIDEGEDVFSVRSFREILDEIDTSARSNRRPSSHSSVPGAKS
ncbi:MAG TPA: hypothetical protein VGN12_16795 [Pirellulales bacterium]|jgi:hypothetical protein